MVCNDESIYQSSKLINVISISKYWYSNHFKMASKFGGILRALKLKENGEVHYNMNFVIFF